MKAVAEFEISFSEEELDKFAALAKELNKDFPETVRQCMNERCDQLLHSLQEVPLKD